MTTTNSELNPRASRLRFIGLGLILGAILLFIFGPISSLPFDVHRGFYHLGAWSSVDDVPYKAIVLIQRLAPSLTLMVLCLAAGGILLVFSRQLSGELARIPKMTPPEKTRLLNAVAMTVALYTLSLAACGAVIEYGYVSLSLYPGFRPLLRYASHIGIIALLLFLFAKGSRFRWLLLLSGILLLFWAV